MRRKTQNGSESCAYSKDIEQSENLIAIACTENTY
jgi:hypothetical protein